MTRFLNSLRRALPTKAGSARRPRPYRPQLEPLDERLVPSTLSSAITIQHSGWTEQDWYTIDQNTGQVVEFQGTTRHDLGGPVIASSVSASVDPYTGFGEVFALASPIGSTYGALWLCDSYGSWYNFGGFYRDISATHDGHVYAVTGFGDVHSVDSLGNTTNLGAPSTGVALTYPGWFGSTVTSSIAASVGWFGGNEVFAIGNDRAIYVNSANASGHWGLVDNHQSFYTLSATVNDTVFAVSETNAVYQETQHWGFSGWFMYSYWSEQNITPYWASFSAISAGTNGSGQDEVYGIDASGNLYVYDTKLDSWTWKDSGVVDIAAADGGYFYDVNYYGGGNSYDYQWNPNGWPTYLGSDLS